MKQLARTPTRKVAAATLASAITTIVIIIIREATDYQPDEGLIGAINTLVIFAAGYFVPPAAHDGIEST